MNWYGRPSTMSLYAATALTCVSSYHRTTAPTIEQQKKLNNLNSQLSRAKMRKDKHLIKQIEDQIRKLTNEVNS